MNIRFVRGIIMLLAVIIGLSVGRIWALQSQPSILMVSGLNQPIEILATQKRLDTALAAAGISLDEGDILTPPPDTALKAGSQVAVHIQKAVTVTLIHDGETRLIRSAQPSVAALLNRLALTVGPHDLVSVDPGSPLAEGLEIQIVRRTEEVVVETTEIPFRTIRREGTELALGESKELQSGSVGLLETHRLVRREDGVEVSLEIVDERVVVQPTDQVVLHGTVSVVARGGENFRYVKEMEMEATGYTAGPESNPNGNGYTYTGIKAVRGVVAVDPQVIPLYTRVYVEGYGPAVAADIGGAIKGTKIDLCFDTVEEALQWGRRAVKVYILED